MGSESCYGFVQDGNSTARGVQRISSRPSIFIQKICVIPQQFLSVESSSAGSSHRSIDLHPFKGVLRQARARLHG
jgi:hypothetical protein